ncbi:YwmB family TATA-box binding protein [Paraliobacillus sp. JSM ZJ581]|uniref:YwmB family TATA-box binding protein n=1 Tax=Paraliobacillus sp. JSM ZJ581 TaxID=3342118 RepID=UPI0035A832DC
MKQKICLIVCLCLVLVTNHIHAVSKNNRLIEELKQIEHIFHTNDQSVIHWQIQLRETIDKKQLKYYMAKINKIFPNSNIELEKTTHAKKYKWNEQKKSSVNESIMIVEAKKASTVEIIYVVEVNEKASIEKSINKSRAFQLDGSIFTNDVKKFTCAKTEIDDMIDSVYFFEKIKKSLQVQEIHKLNEKDFTVFSGFTKEWETSIPSSNHNQMNIQMAARQVSGEKTMITVGTPILTTEY